MTFEEPSIISANGFSRKGHYSEPQERNTPSLRLANISGTLGFTIDKPDAVG